MILDHYPIETIRNISLRFISFGPWDEELLTIEGEELSLNDIEHRILTNNLGKIPRIHYALNCASMGCPNLRPLAFTALNSKLLLEQGANEYINHPRATKKQKNLVFPKFMNGIRMILAGNETGVLIHQLKYVKGNWANSLNEDELGI